MALTINGLRRSGNRTVHRYAARMRWEGLFADLEGQVEEQSRLERDAEVAERTRGERAQVELLARLLGALESPVRVRLCTGATRQGLLCDVGADWLLLDEGGRREVLVPLGALVGLSDLPARAREDRTARRFALGSALRALSRDRSPVTITDLAGGTSSGTIDAVGADWVDLSEHPLGELRRASAITGRRTVPFHGLACIESAQRPRSS